MVIGTARITAPYHDKFWSLPLRIGSGQVARLLLSLDMAAVSQAPSPESNPNSPSPVAGTVSHDLTVQTMMDQTVE